MYLSKTSQILVIAALLGVSLAASCKEDLYCGACSESTANVCTGCTTSGRYMSSDADKNCKSTLSKAKVTDCKYYATMKTADTIDTSDCKVCNGKTFLNIDTSSGSTVIGCSDTAIDTSTCDAAITDCLQTVCRKTAIGASKYCTYCKNSKVPASDGKSCVTTGAITSCEQHWLDSTTPKCHQCASGYAIASDELSCKVNTDTNCGKLFSDGTNCAVCNPGYRFNGSVCSLKSWVMYSLSGLFMTCMLWLS